jgi:hypothetical protein
MTARAQQRSADVGLRVADYGSGSRAVHGPGFAKPNPQLDIRNLRLRSIAPFCCALLLVAIIGIPASAQTQVHDAFESAGAEAAEDAGVEQPPAMVPQATSEQLNQESPASANGGILNSLLQLGKGAATGEPEQGGEALPPQTIGGKLPLAGTRSGAGMQVSQESNGLYSFVVRDKSLSDVLALVAEQGQLNIVAANSLDALITITLHDVSLEQALTSILSVANYTWVERNGIILVTSLTEATELPADVQGRQVQVFELDFADATDVQTAITTTGFLSPVGKVSISASDPADNRKTREIVVVEDVPASLARIAAYIAQIDQPPRQVLIEAHVLQVTLTDETRCGVDFHALCRIAGSNANVFSIPGNAAPLPVPGASPAPPAGTAFLATFAGNDLQAIIELMQTTTDTKTLGSPKILVLNEQEANVHVGESIGYQTSTTTDVSISQAPQFLDVGVTLRLTPRITRDGRVLLNVRPEVSSGEFNPESNAPDKRTTELETDVMLEDGQGMVIGGLIRENDSVTQGKVPYLGDVKGIGWMFRKKTVNKERVEIIFALVPRVQPYDPQYQAFEQGELVRAGVPLLEGPLCRTNRPWDPILPDGKRVYRPIVPKHPHQMIRRGRRDSEYIVPSHPMPVQRFDNADGEPMWQESAASAPQRAFLSDEPMLLPPDSGAGPHGPTVITDQE